MAKEDDEYPEWLWGLLGDKGTKGGKGDGGEGGDEFGEFFSLDGESSYGWCRV